MDKQANLPVYKDIQLSDQHLEWVGNRLSVLTPHRVGCEFQNYFDQSYLTWVTILEPQTQRILHYTAANHATTLNSSTASSVITGTCPSLHTNPIFNHSMMAQKVLLQLTASIDPLKKVTSIYIFTETTMDALKHVIL